MNKSFNKTLLLFFMPLAIFLNSCIGEDILLDAVKPTLRITSCLDSLENGTDFQLKASYFNYVGEREDVTIEWSSSNTDIVSVTNSGQVTGVAKGQAVVTASYLSPDGLVSDKLTINVGNSNYCTPVEKSGTIMTTSSYKLQGDFVMYTEGNNLIIEIADNWESTDVLPGLYVYLTNNNTTTVGAYEIGAVTTFSGAHTYTVPGVGLNDFRYLLYFCKPFNVKVGDGEISE